MMSNKAFQLDWYQSHCDLMTGRRNTAVTAAPHTQLGGRKKRCKLNTNTSG